MEWAARAILQQPLSDINAQPKVFHRSLLAYLNHPPFDLSFDLYVLHEALKRGWKIETVDVSFDKRLHGESKWAFSFKSKARHITSAIKYMVQLAKSSR